MTDGWEHHHDDPGGHHLPDPADDLVAVPEQVPFDAGPADDDGWDEPDPYTEQPDLPDTPEPEPAGHPGDAAAPVVEHGQPVGADPDAVAEPAAADVFPPALDVGPLPEPVDGFPWIDTGSLGAADIAAAAEPTGGPSAADLAAHAATDLPPGVDPWAHLAASDDPATAALARFYRPGGAAAE